MSTPLLVNAWFKIAVDNSMCYTAATCDPDDFPKKYDLRPRRYNRQIKIALVVTMYNEDDGWLEKLCCLHVSDGRTKINPRVLTVLGAMGIYMDGLPRSSVNGEPVTGHIFEFTTQIAIDRDMAVRTRKMGIFPTQVIFVLKEKNAKKINSHKWFFNAVCEVIFPEVTMLLDVGTKPSAVSFYHLYRAFERDPRIGGACGEIAAELGPSCGNLLNPLVATQNFEYKMSNILDKPSSQSLVISRAPWCLFCLSLQALQGEPLYKYFLGEKPGADIFTSNLYLAKIVFFALNSSPRNMRLGFSSTFKSAVAETDCAQHPSRAHLAGVGAGLNGSFFASVHAISNFSQIFQSPHSSIQKFIFSVEFVYNAIQSGL
ncbi:hypothetical protein BASA83_007393 [Batrachochytrium salamandrivorans]|nr:hypothetical protein BASA83_007393 [Batrachochytrium salamandrivorans]